MDSSRGLPALPRRERRLHARAGQPGGGDHRHRPRDAGPAGSYYKLSAVDLNGNEGAYALVGPGQTTDVPGGPVLTFSLEAVRPNPASSRDLTVSFVLPVGAAARLELLDVAGRRVTAREVGGLGVGAHTVNLAAGARIRTGLYFVRLRQGANERAARVTVLE